MKIFLNVIFLVLLLSGCVLDTSIKTTPIEKLDTSKKTLFVGTLGVDITLYDRNEVYYMLYLPTSVENKLFFIPDEIFRPRVKPEDFEEYLDYDVNISGFDAYKKFLKKESLKKRYVSQSPKIFINDYKFNVVFVGYGDTNKKAVEDLILKCENFKTKKLANKNLFFKCANNLLTKETKPSIILKKYSEMFIYAEEKIKYMKSLEIKKTKTDEENKIIYGVKLLQDSMDKKCKEIGFTIDRESLAKCILKIAELIELKKNILNKGFSRASLKAQLQQHQIEIQEEIATNAREPRIKQAWGVLLGMTMGSDFLDSSNIKLFSSSAVKCIKTRETISGTNKICFYNCMQSIRRINVGKMRYCPININK